MAEDNGSKVQEAVRSVSSLTTGSVVAVAITNMLSELIFISAMCYCLSTGHWKFAVACIVGAFVSGMSLRTHAKAKSGDDED